MCSQKASCSKRCRTLSGNRAVRGFHAQPLDLLPSFHQGSYTFIVQLDPFVGQLGLDAVNQGNDGQHEWVGSQVFETRLLHNRFDQVLGLSPGRDRVFFASIVPLCDKVADVVLTEGQDGVMDKIAPVEVELPRSRPSREVMR